MSVAGPSSHRSVESSFEPGTFRVGDHAFGTGTGQVRDSVSLEILVEGGKRDGCCITSRFAMPHTEEVALDDLLAGPKLIVFEERGVMLTMTITTERV
ncbi:MAG: hypothetical protein ACRDY6_12715 [Acidimicrobiia bacterium]